MTSTNDNEQGFLAHRRLADGRLLSVIPLTFGRARICLGPDVVYIEEVW